MGGEVTPFGLVQPPATGVKIFICSYLRRNWLGHINKIHCFSSFCLQKIGEGEFIFRGQRSYATLFTGVNRDESKGKQQQYRSKRVKKNRNGFNFVGCTNASS